MNNGAGVDVKKRAKGPVIVDLAQASVKEIWNALRAVDENADRKWSDDQRAVLLDQLYDEFARRLRRHPRTWK